MNDLLSFITMAMAICGGALSTVLGISRHKKLSVKISGVFLMAVSGMVILGYFFNSPSLYTIPTHGVGVAFPTAVCFFVLGGNLLILSNGPLK